MRVFEHVSLVLVTGVLVGCNAVGPRAINGARLNYNEAIANSWEQQLLLNLVRLRYRDTPLFLEVSSVSTQYSMTYTAGAASGFGSAETLTRGAGVNPSAGAGAAVDLAAGAVTGGLTRNRGLGGSASRGRSRIHNRGMDFDTGISYYERPTVMYSPLQGQKFVKQMLSPIPVEAVALLSESGWSAARVMRLCLQEMNGLENAPAASGPTPDWVPEYEDFTRAARLMRRMQLKNAIEYAVEQTEEGPQLLVCFARDAKDTPEARELMELLRLKPGREQFRISQRRYTANGDELAVRCRSLLGVLYFLSQSVDPPDDHAEAGLVTVTRRDDGTPFDWAEITGDLLRIHSQDAVPRRAFVKTRYRGTWFYIDDADLNSKSTFGLLSFLFYLQAGDVASISPTLTLPVGG